MLGSYIFCPLTQKGRVGYVNPIHRFSPVTSALVPTHEIQFMWHNTAKLLRHMRTDCSKVLSAEPSISVVPFQLDPANNYQFLMFL